MGSAQSLCVTMNGIGRVFHNSLQHREVRYDATASLDGSCIGGPELVPPANRRESDQAPEKVPLRWAVGLLRAGRPVVCRMARKLPDRGTKFLSRLDRLEGHLNQADDLDQKVKDALPGLWLPLVADETPIILDLSDIAKPLAKKMDYLATVRDGSTG